MLGQSEFTADCRNEYCPRWVVIHNCVYFSPFLCYFCNLGTCLSAGRRLTASSYMMRDYGSPGRCVCMHVCGSYKPHSGNKSVGGEGGSSGSVFKNTLFHFYGLRFDIYIYR